jgi:hypothetical protein
MIMTLLDWIEGCSDSRTPGENSSPTPLKHLPLLKPYLRVFRGVSKYNLAGYVGFFQFLWNFRQYNACEQAELILQAALDPAIASRAKKGEFVRCFDHFDLLQTAIN